jgi:SAM-dependent methyltransferase
MLTIKGYTTTRFIFDQKRRLVWEEICRYLNRHFIPECTRILELGSGYGDFIGNIKARERVAIEIDDFFQEHVNTYSDITIHFADANVILDTLPKQSFDVVFCSNYFEHFEKAGIQGQLSLIHSVLKPGGKLIVVQPNFQLCPARYFDDWTHKSVFSHTSFSDFVECHRFQVDTCLKRFLPFSMKSRLPISRLLIRLYLNSPIKPFAGQFLLVAKAV